MTLETATLFHDSPYAKTLVTFVNSFRITENIIFMIIAFISFHTRISKYLPIDTETSENQCSIPSDLSKEKKKEKQYTLEKVTNELIVA